LLPAQRVGIERREEEWLVTSVRFVGFAAVRA
jgi:hypothetical protein